MQRRKLVPKEALEKHAGKSAQKIGRLLGVSAGTVKNSQIEHGIFNGKLYEFTCTGCRKPFKRFTDSGYLFCSNECKHDYQIIWNRGLKSEDSAHIQASSARLAKNNPGANGHRSTCLKTETLKILGDVEYDSRSELERTWIRQLDEKPGVVSCRRCDITISYVDYLGKICNYFPDFIVEWESGVKWVVEVKGVMTERDLFKVDQARQKCSDLGYEYRFITQGLVKECAWLDQKVFIEHEFTGKNNPPPELLMMNQACSWALMSHGKRAKVGCVISTIDMSQILAFGYNGDEAGGANCPLCLLPGQDGFLHAEENALLKVTLDEPASMFITLSPCDMCAKRIINSRKIAQVYYLSEYRDLSGVSLLVSRGIPVYKLLVANQFGRILSTKEAWNILAPRIVPDQFGTIDQFVGS